MTHYHYSLGPAFVIACGDQVYVNEQWLDVLDVREDSADGISTPNLIFTLSEGEPITRRHNAPMSIRWPAQTSPGFVR